MVHEAAIGYPDKLLARDISFILRRGECLGIIGPNGSGKTTFLRTILKKIPALAGDIQWGTKVQIGYYAQQLDDLDDRNEIIMELRRVAPANATAGELRSFLAKFLFTGDDVYKKVADLSGGEKGRLALAKLIYSRVNVLVLDEPTNHLDIPSREALEEALDAYEGTILTISHDRYFLDRVATQMLALDGQGAAEHYDGDYTEYHDWRAGVSGAVAAASVSSTGNMVETLFQGEPAPPSEPEAPSSSSTSKRRRKIKDGPASAKAGVRVVKKKKPEARTAHMIETAIADAEKKLVDLSQQMGLPEVARNPEQLIKLDGDYRQTENELQTLYEEWENAAAQNVP
jgi:ATP-binding cassette subfamily F protein 3